MLSEGNVTTHAQQSAKDLGLGPETGAGTARGTGHSGSNRGRGRGRWRHLRGLHPSAVAIVVDVVVVVVAVEAAFVASFMHLNNLKPQD